MFLRTGLLTVVASVSLLGAMAVPRPVEAKGFGGGYGGGGGFVGARAIGIVGGAHAIGRFGRPSVRFHGRGGWGHGHGWNRFGHGRHGYGNRGYGYGGLPLYGSYGPGYGGYPVLDRPYDPRSSQPTVGISPSPVLPPAIYVIGKSGRGAVVRKGAGARTR